MEHFEDRQKWCCGCHKYITIKFNQVGGYWYLRNYESESGELIFGGHCTPCFDKIRSKTK